MSLRLRNAPLSAPVNVTWEVTRACNLECRHCLSAALPQGEEELDFEECCALIDELACLRVFQVNFGGGEPFLRKDFLEILRYTCAQGLTACVSTNGTVLSEDLVRELMDLQAVGPVYLQVSLDGATAETNDAIRGPGTYDRIMAGVEMLASYHYPGLSLNLVVTRLNFAEVGEFDRLARSFGAKTRLSRFRPSGRGAEVWEEFRLRPEQLRELSSFLGKHPEILTGDSFFALTPAGRRNLGLDMCGAGKMTCAITPAGDVYPCAFLCAPGFWAGSVRTQSFAEIFHTSAVLERFRQLEVQSCRSCGRFSVCHGGCPAVAYFLTDSLDFPDPECLRAAVSVEEVL